LTALKRNAESFKLGFNKKVKIEMKIARWLIGSLLIVCIGSILYTIYIPISFKGESIVVNIPTGSTPQNIGELLETHQLIRKSSSFYWYIRSIGLKEPLRAGSFLISPTNSVPQIIKLLQKSSGSYHLARVTIPEGYNIWEIAKVLDQKGVADYETIIDYWHVKAKVDFEDDYPFLKEIPVQTLEGYLYPETYYIPKGNNALKTLTRLMLTQFQRRIIPLWEKDPSVKGSPKARFSLHQVLTIGSLIEKEARLKSEMSLISSVFYNRLRRRMLLGSDPTVVYAMGKSYKKRVLYKDTKVESPYNTYKHTGFMPSPISSVSESAFKASLRPEKTNDLFFVANRDGSHIFTKTYKEHLHVQKQR